MFNSVAKYLWGGVENEADYSDRPEQGPGVRETPNPDDGDWILVDSFGEFCSIYLSSPKFSLKRIMKHLDEFERDILQTCIGQERILF